jgi:hypothetical protein
VRDHHRFLLGQYLDEWKDLGKRICADRGRDRRHRNFEEAVTLGQSIPGADRVTASNLVAEIGVDINRFPTDRKLASWWPCVPATMSPGSECRARHGTGTNGCGARCVKRLGRLPARRTATCRHKFKRLAAGRGVKRAVMAMARTMLIIGYHRLKTAKATTHWEAVSGAAQQGSTPERLREAITTTRAEGYRRTGNPSRLRTIFEGAKSWCSRRLVVMQHKV